MKPISRLRMRARCDMLSSATDLPLSVYWPSVGESSRPRIESSVDLPQPDGPAIETYSPRRIRSSIECSAWVSTSSVKKTLLTPSRWISGSPSFSVCIRVMEIASKNCPRSGSVEPDPIEVLELRDVGEDDLVAHLEAAHDLDGRDRAAAELDRHPHRVSTAGFEAEQA